MKPLKLTVIEGLSPKEWAAYKLAQGTRHTFSITDGLAGHKEIIVSTLQINEDGTPDKDYVAEKITVGKDPKNIPRTADKPSPETVFATARELFKGAFAGQTTGQDVSSSGNFNRQVQQDNATDQTHTTTRC